MAQTSHLKQALLPCSVQVCPQAVNDEEGWSVVGVESRKGDIEGDHNISACTFHTKQSLGRVSLRGRGRGEGNKEKPRSA